MNQPKKVPDPEKVKRTVERLRESNRQLEILALKMDELLARMDSDLRRQRLERLERRGKFKTDSESSE